MTIDLVPLIQPYLLLFARFSTVLTTTIGFGEHHVPVRFRLLFSLGLAIILKEYIPSTLEKTSDLMFVMLIFQEVIIGFAIGFIGRLLLSLLDVLGSILSMQIGLGNAMMFNPSLGGQTPLTSNLLIMSGTFLFFTLDLHYFVIQGLISTYNVFPLQPGFKGFEGIKDLTLHLTGLFNKGLIMICQLALPFLILGVVFQFMLGLLNRLVPSLQIFFVMLPAQIILGFLLMAITVTSALGLFMKNFAELYQSFPLFTQLP